MAQRPSLFFDGRAFAARRSALLDVGPPHPDIGDVFADVDWSWRLWLAGHRVLTSDRTAVLEKDTGTHAVERLPASMRRAREQRAAHRILAEVLEPDNLTRAFALSSAIEAADAGEDTDGLLGTDPRGLTRPTRGQAREALVRPAALHAVGAGGDELAAERATIQAARVVSDEELFAEVGTVFRAYADTPEGTALRRLLLPRVQRVRPAVLILCSDDLGELMAGPAIRAVELARALMPGVDPIIAAHRVDPRVELPCPAVALSTDLLKGLLDDADAVVLQGPVTDWFPQVLRSGVPLAIDLYDPMHLEALQRAGAVAEMPHVLNLVVDQLRRGDFFFCASERQRDYWLGMLSSLGRVTADAYAEDPDLRGLIDVVPFGIPSEPPTRVASGPRETVDGIGVDDVLLVWNGGLWDWFDPETFLRALAAVREELPMLRAYFMGVRRPGSTELAPAARRVMALSDELGLTGSTVFFNDWTPYDTRQDVYLDASAIVSLHHAHLESRFSFRTRLLDALWGRVPIICTRGDVVAGIVEELQLGVTVPPGDVDAVVQALRDFATDPALLDRTRAQLEIAAPAYEWAHAVAPLARWLAAPGRRTDPAVLVGGPACREPATGAARGVRALHGRAEARGADARATARAGPGEASPAGCCASATGCALIATSQPPAPGLDAPAHPPGSRPGPRTARAWISRSPVRCLPWPRYGSAEQRPLIATSPPLAPGIDVVGRGADRPAGDVSRRSVHRPRPACARAAAGRDLRLRRRAPRAGVRAARRDLPRRLRAEDRRLGQPPIVGRDRIILGLGQKRPTPDDVVIRGLDHPYDAEVRTARDAGLPGRHDVPAERGDPAAALLRTR